MNPLEFTDPPWGKRVKPHPDARPAILADDSDEPLSKDEEQDNESEDTIPVGLLPAPSSLGQYGLQLSRVSSEEENDSAWSQEDAQPLSSDDEAPQREMLKAVEIRPSEISSKEFLYLPGHFTVRKIIERRERYGESVYSIQRESGEHDQVSLAVLSTLRRARSALRDYSEMELRARRKALKPEGFVDWEDVDVDPNESEGQEHRRFSRRHQLPSEAAASEPPSQSEISDSETPRHTEVADADSDFLEESSPARHSKRIAIRGPRKVHTAFEDLEDSTDTESDILEGRPRKRRHTSSYKALMSSRRSDRTRNIPRRDMRERLEDDISEKEVEKRRSKVVATKEIFSKLPHDNHFRRMHRQICVACEESGDHDDKGSLVFCQGCSFAYHQSCLGNRGSRDHLVTKVDEAEFVLQCRRCIGLAHRKDHTAPHLGQCSMCQKLGPINEPLRARLTSHQEQVQREANGGVDPITIVDLHVINQPDNVLFRCVKCTRAWHWHHLPPRTAHNYEGEDGLTDEQLSRIRYEEYYQASICGDCHMSKDAIDTLVAWRPVDLESFIPGYTVGMMDETAKEYLVKWKKHSHLRDTWMPGAWIWAVAPSATRTAFIKRPENQLPRMTMEDAIPEDYLRVDIIFGVQYTNVVSQRTREIDVARIKDVSDVYVKYKGLGYEDAVWEKPPRPEDKGRWEDFKAAYEEWVLINYVHPPRKTTLYNKLSAVREQDFETTLVKTRQPSTMTGGELMQYQLDGLNWLHYQWFKEQNAILADEMGLGKTIQVIGFFATMIHDHQCWPFLVVVPNSTCPNWRREIKKWVPSIRVVTYFGTATARQLALDYELFPDQGNSGDMRAHVVVTSYEAMQDDDARRPLARISWQGVVVDEGQRLKSDKTILYDALTKMRFPFKLLLTGTPLQNNTRELFNLLQFLDKNIDAAKMEVEYENLNNEKLVQLHGLIRPFFLRRTKVQVLTFLPPVAQIILPVTMTSVQKKVYKSILAKNPQIMKSVFSRPDGFATGKERHSLNNILMQLRKVLCHPFVYSQEIEERTTNRAVSHRNLVDAAGKLKLFEIMFPKLHERGHRVLLFSQFLDNLDIMEDFLDGLGLRHRRLDGNISAMEKQKRIDEFNAPNSPLFAFLLSTRAGGVGINLATADTVIIMDPDFNPHQDIQALSRAHRIGQKKKVLVFQVMTRNSAEEKIMSAGKKKMALDHVLIQQMGHDDDAGVDLESILKHGAAALFDENTPDDDIHYDSASVDALLDRSNIEDTDAGKDQSAESQFSFAKVWVNDRSTLEDRLGDADDKEAPPNVDIWDKIMQAREKAFQEEAKAKAQALGRGKRKRQNVDYSLGPIDDDPTGTPKRGEFGSEASDTDFRADPDEADESNQDIPADLALDLNSRKQATGGRSRQKPSTPRQTIKGKRSRKPSILESSVPKVSSVDRSPDISTTSPFPPLDLTPPTYDLLAYATPTRQPAFTWSPITGPTPHIGSMTYPFVRTAPQHFNIQGLGRASGSVSSGTVLDYYPDPFFVPRPPAPIPFLPPRAPQPEQVPASVQPAREPLWPPLLALATAAANAAAAASASQDEPNPPEANTSPTTPSNDLSKQ